MISVAQLFPPPSESPDFSSGALDVVDVFNNFVAPKLNDLLEDAQVVEDPFIEQADASVDSAQNNFQQALQQNPEEEERQIFGQEQLDQVTETPTSLTPEDNFLSALDSPTEVSPRQEESPIANQDEVPFEPVSGQNFNVSNKTRDQIRGFKSRRGNRFVSLDFNDADRKTARGIEIKIPDDATKAEKAAARAWAKRTQAFFADKGVKVPIRRGDGIKEGGRGISGVFHAEPFFASDTAARKAIEQDPQGFAKVYADTLGAIPGVTFIPPHEQGARGGTVSGGVNERDFALKTFLPALSKLAN